MRILVQRVILALSVLSFAASAADKPDYSGTWKLNKAKSDLGPMGDRMPDDITYTIEHKDPELKTTSPGMRGGMQTMKYSTDGKETVNPQGPSEAKSITKWDGDKLVVTTTRDMQGQTMTVTDTWNLAEDKKSLTMNRKMATPMGDFEMKMLLEKQ